MKLKMIIAVAAMTLSLPAFAWNNGYGNSDNGYTSSFGNRYQYDLSNPTDRLGYSVDVGAQLRDRMDLNPSRTLERGLGEYGGGIWED